jgi:hypothetical protein
MAKTLAEKMYLKPNYSCVLLHLPEELKVDFERANTDFKDLKGVHEFILTFYTTKNDLQREIIKIKKTLQENGLLWIAYPKGKGLQTDLNRDILHELMKEYGWDGVSIVSLNDIWSAMRFKKM